MNNNLESETVKSTAYEEEEEKKKTNALHQPASISQSTFSTHQF